MFFIDKYQITDKHEVLYNEYIYNKFLKNNLNDKTNFFFPWRQFYNLPNLCVYGRKGSGKRSFINILLKNMFGKYVENKCIQKYQIRGYGNSIIEVEIEQSPVHIIIKPNNTGFDKYYVQEIIKKYAGDKNLEFSDSNNRFKVVIIDSIDNMSYYAQTSLRRTMETYCTNCKFIFCCYELSKVIEPLRSRCLLLNIPSPTNTDLFKISKFVCFKENISISDDNLCKLILDSNNNIKTLFWNLECFNKNISTQNELTTKLKLIIDTIMNVKSKKLNFDILKNLRLNLYTIFITNYSQEYIINCITIELIKKIDNLELRQKLLNISCKFYVRLHVGKRSIEHLEALIFNLMNCIYMDAKDKYKMNKTKTT